MISKTIGCVTILAVFFIASHMDNTDAVVQQEYECELINLWNADRDANIKPIDRRGYPARTPEQDEECKHGNR